MLFTECFFFGVLCVVILEMDFNWGVLFPRTSFDREDSVIGGIQKQCQSSLEFCEAIIAA